MNKEIKIGDYVEYEPEVRVSKKYNVYDGEKFKKTNKYFISQKQNKIIKLLICKITILHLLYHNLEFLQYRNNILLPIFVQYLYCRAL